MRRARGWPGRSSLHRRTCQGLTQASKPSRGDRWEPGVTHHHTQLGVQPRFQGLRPVWTEQSKYLAGATSTPMRSSARTSLRRSTDRRPGSRARKSNYSLAIACVAFQPVGLAPPTPSTRSRRSLAVRWCAAEGGLLRKTAWLASGRFTSWRPKGVRFAATLPPRASWRNRDTARGNRVLYQWPRGGEKPGLARTAAGS